MRTPWSVFKVGLHNGSTSPIVGMAKGLASMFWRTAICEVARVYRYDITNWLTLKWTQVDEIEHPLLVPSFTPIFALTRIEQRGPIEEPD